MDCTIADAVICWTPVIEEAAMTFAPDIEEALSRLAKDEGLTREEALAGLVRDWLIENDYLGDQDK
jgi:hypothetical protein